MKSRVAFPPLECSQSSKRMICKVANVNTVENCLTNRQIKLCKKVMVNVYHIVNMTHFAQEYKNTDFHQGQLNNNTSR